MSELFSYYDLKLKIFRKQLATLPSADIYHQHVIERAKKEIAAANKLTNKITKNLSKYVGVEITANKEIEELKNILRSYQALTGDTTLLPDTIEALLVFASELREKFDELVAAGEQQKATVFLTDVDGDTCISTHMVLGFVKECLRNVVNGGNKTMYKSKVALSEGMAQDLKFCQEFVKASNQYMKKEDGTPDLSIRPIRFEIMGKSTTAIAMSQQLPEGTEYSLTCRIRKGSPIDSLEVLEFIFGHGRNLGLGQGRGSLGAGAFVFKIAPLTDYKEVIYDGWK